ncbi:MAG: AAA family ATPase, partial [Pseudanabaena sp.]
MEEKIRYTEILFPSESPFSNYVVNESKPLATLSPVNIFIGSNNCGKSRLLRSLFSLNNFRYKTNHYNAQSYYDFLMRINPEFQFAFTNTPRPLTEVGSISIKHIENKLQDQDPNFIDTKNPIYKVAEDILQTLINIDKTTHKQFEVYTYAICNIGEKYKLEFDALNVDTKLGDEKRYYIPVLRGMRPLDVDDQHKNFYSDRTKWDYFKNSDSLTEKMQIFTGLELYQSLKEKLLGEPEERQLVKEFENFLSVSFFESKSVTLIPKEKSPKVVHIKIGNEPQYPIYELGDGLQNLIICTFNIFTEKERCLFFIEEPDMFMHPSLQRAFLEVLSEYDQHQYFITSHSNHFLDMTIDFANISVFHFSKHEDTQPQFHIRPSSPRDRRILLDLGVRNSSVFITNATIWVEGKTDRLYLKAYMKKYIDELKEDINRIVEDNSDIKKSLKKRYLELSTLKEDYHYSFVEYQGANLTHWSFDPDEKEIEEIKASYVCAHAFLIADGDVATKGDRKQVYTDMLGNRFHLLEVKEIENLMPVEILRQVVAEEFKENEGNIEHINYEDYAKLDTPIGKYLDSLLKAIPEGKTVFAAINRSKTKSEGSGTIKSKGTFCDDAIKFMQNPECKWALTESLK